MRLNTVRNRIRLYRFHRHCDEMLRQARHGDYPLNRSLQFGNSRGYWILLAVAFAVLIAAQVFKHHG